jgi:hypothetical protein
MTWVKANMDILSNIKPPDNAGRNELSSRVVVVPSRGPAHGGRGAEFEFSAFSHNWRLDVRVIITQAELWERIIDVAWDVAFTKLAFYELCGRLYSCICLESSSLERA